MRQLGIDVETCPRCGGKLKVIALVRAPASIARYLRHLGLPTEERAHVCLETGNRWPEAGFSSEFAPLRPRADTARALLAPPLPRSTGPEAPRPRHGSAPWKRAA